MSARQGSGSQAAQTARMQKKRLMMTPFFHSSLSPKTPLTGLEESEDRFNVEEEIVLARNAAAAAHAQQEQEYLASLTSKTYSSENVPMESVVNVDEEIDAERNAARVIRDRAGYQQRT